jgi:hypothetical protein
MQSLASQLLTRVGGSNDVQMLSGFCATFFQGGWAGFC